MGKITLQLLALLSWLQYSLWLGKNGIRDLMRIQSEILLQHNNNIKLQARNNLLLAEINDLNGNQEAIEELSRNQLGMIKSGETFYRLVPDQTKRQQVASVIQ